MRATLAVLFIFALILCSYTISAFTDKIEDIRDELSRLQQVYADLKGEGKDVEAETLRGELSKLVLVCIYMIAFCHLTIFLFLIY